MEVTLSESPALRAVHFVNATGLNPVGTVVPVEIGAVRVTLPPGSTCRVARRIAAGDDIAFHQEGNVVQFSLGRLETYEVVALHLHPKTSAGT